MEWKELAVDIGKIAPLIGGIIGGPVAPITAAVGGMIASVLGCENTPDAVAVAMKTDPEAAVKIAQIQKDKEVGLKALEADMAKDEITGYSQNASDINLTMQAEAQSEHWITYSWRGIMGLAVAFNTVMSSLAVIVIFFALLLGSDKASLAVANLPLVLGALAAISAAVMPVLGVASWFRGKGQADPSIPAAIRL